MSEPTLDFEKEAPHTGGRPEHVPTDASRAEVCALTSYGITQERIAGYLGVTVPTLYKYYRAELDNSAMLANAKVARKLHSLAVDDGNVSAAIFWLKVRDGWREKAPEADPNSRPVVNIYNGLPSEPESHES